MLGADLLVHRRLEDPACNPCRRPSPRTSRRRRCAAAHRMPSPGWRGRRRCSERPGTGSRRPRRGSRTAPRPARRSARARPSRPMLDEHRELVASQPGGRDPLRSQGSRSRAPTSIRRWFPAAWPCVSLIDLKSSRSRKSTAGEESRIAPRRGRRSTRLEEGRAVRELGQGVVVGEVMELLLQLRDVGERLLEATVLEQHARMAGERPHERLLVPRERGDVARAVAGDHQPEDPAVVGEGGDDHVGETPCGHERGQRRRGRPRAPREPTRRASRAPPGSLARPHRPAREPSTCRCRVLETLRSACPSSSNSSTISA